MAEGRSRVWGAPWGSTTYLLVDAGFLRFLAESCSGGRGLGACLEAELLGLLVTLG